MALRLGDPFPQLWLRFRELRPPDGAGQPSSATAWRWQPPDCPESLELTFDTGWHIFIPGRQNTENRLDNASTGPNLPSHIAPYDTTSLFYTTEFDNFLEVPWDCKQHHVSDMSQEYTEDGWNRLTFQHANSGGLPGQHPTLWIIGHALPHVQMDNSVNITDSWEDLLRLPCFENGSQHRNIPPTCQLVGKLSMIIGLVAFMSQQGNQIDLVDKVRHCFRARGTTTYLPRWSRGQAVDEGIVNRRGLIVDVAYDKTRYEHEELVRWESGKNGAILTSDHPYSQRP